MKSIVLVTLLFGSLAFAQNENSVSTEVNRSEGAKAIRAGNYELNGSFNLSQSQSDNLGSTTFFSVRPDFGYFIADRFLLGGSLDFFASTNDAGTVRSTGIGPRAAYFFWESGALAADVSQRVLYYRTENLGRWTGITSVGAKYFFNPNVAFGVDFGVAYGLDGAGQRTSTALNGAFATYF